MFSREASVDCCSEQFGVAEGVRNSLRRIGVLVVASITHQCPTGSVGLAQEVGQIARAHVSLLSLAATQTLGKMRCQVKHLLVVICDVGAEGVEFPAGYLDETVDQAVI